MLRNRTFVLIALALAALFTLPGVSQAQGTANVTGIVTLRERIALPSNAVVTMQLAEVRTGQPNLVVAEQTFSTNGAQAPFSFTLPYDPARVSPNAIYIIQANIRYSNAVQFTTTAQHRVITGGNPTANVQVLMVRVGSGSLPTTSGGTTPLLIAAALLIAALSTIMLRRRAVRQALR